MSVDGITVKWTPDDVIYLLPLNHTNSYTAIPNTNITSRFSTASDLISPDGHSADFGSSSTIASGTDYIAIVNNGTTASYYFYGTSNYFSLTVTPNQYFSSNDIAGSAAYYTRVASEGSAKTAEDGSITFTMKPLTTKLDFHLTGYPAGSHIRYVSVKCDSKIMRRSMRYSPATLTITGTDSSSSNIDEYTVSFDGQGAEVDASGNITVPIMMVPWTLTSGSTLTFAVLWDDGTGSYTGTYSFTASADRTFSGGKRSTTTIPYAAANNQIVSLSGKGTEAEPFLIQNADDLYALNGLVRTGGYFYALTADIDITSRTGYSATDEWTGIGTGMAPFIGTFDGRGHTIRGLKCHIPAYSVDTWKGGGLGLFAATKDSVFRNLIIEDPKIYSLDPWQINNPNYAFYHSGALMGAALGTTIVDNCHVVKSSAGADSSIFATSYAGGLVGSSAYQITMTRCSNRGVGVSVYSSDSGGLVGCAMGAGGCMMAVCYSTADVAAPIMSNIGGLIGFASSGNIYCSYVRGIYMNIGTGGTIYAGGLSGNVQCSSCYSDFTTNSISNPTAIGAIGAIAGGGSASYGCATTNTTYTITGNKGSYIFNQTVTDIADAYDWVSRDSFEWLDHTFSFVMNGTTYHPSQIWQDNVTDAPTFNTSIFHYDLTDIMN